MHEELPPAIEAHLDRLAKAMQAQWQIVESPKHGFSSSIIYPVQIASERLALRNWNWPASALDELTAKLNFQLRLSRDWSPHSHVLIHSHSDSPVAIVLDTWANGHMIAQVDNKLWSLSMWRPGASVGWDASLSTAQLASIARALAKMHSISMRYHAVIEPSFGWKDRLRRLRRNAEIQFAASAPCVSDLAAFSDSVIRTVRAGTYFDETIQWLHTQASRAWPSCWIIRDAHQENWLFEGDAVSGIVDFGAARCDWLGWDLVRLLSCAEFNDQQRKDFVGCYLRCLGDSAPQHAASVVASIEALLDEKYWRTLNYLQNLLSAMQWRDWATQERPWTREQMARWKALLDRLT